MRFPVRNAPSKEGVSPFIHRNHFLRVTEMVYIPNIFLPEDAVTANLSNCPKPSQNEDVDPVGKTLKTGAHFGRLAPTKKTGVTNARTKVLWFREALGRRVGPEIGTIRGRKTPDRLSRFDSCPLLESRYFRCKRRWSARKNEYAELKTADQPQLWVRLTRSKKNSQFYIWQWIK